MPRRARLDTELVRRGLARSRDQAAELVAAGRVTVAGQRAAKPATAVAPDTPVVVRPVAAGASYVSRGGEKLAGALDVFEADGLSVAGRRCLDAGASTGGFTEVLLRRGATHIVAVDVGYGQLAWSMRTDPKVQVMERTNVRYLEPSTLGPVLPSLVVADLSFISLRLVLPALRACATDNADFVVMVKPQFEVGRESVGDGGVVRDPAMRAAAVLGVAQSAADLGLGTAGAVASPLPGATGNVEYFLWLRSGAAPPAADVIERAVEDGPS